MNYTKLTPILISLLTGITMTASSCKGLGKTRNTLVLKKPTHNFTTAITKATISPFVKKNVSNYEWKVNPLRNNADLTNLKELWKKAFQNTDASKGLTKTQIINNMSTELKQSLFGQNVNTQLMIFENSIDDTTSNLYKFIN